MESKKSIFIVEDNGINRISLEALLEENNFEILGSFSNAEEAWESLKKNLPEIVLIDINLAGEKDGIWLAKKIRKNLDLPFIYLTAYGDQKTINRLKSTSPNGYLMKPYNEPTLLTTINIATENFSNKNKQNSLYIKENYVRIRLVINEILYIKSEGNYIEIFLKNKKHVVRYRLTDFHKKIPQNDFVQIHRRYIINRNKVDYLKNDFIFINKNKIPISKTYKKNIENI